MLVLGVAIALGYLFDQVSEVVGRQGLVRGSGLPGIAIPVRAGRGLRSGDDGPEHRFGGPWANIRGFMDTGMHPAIAFGVIGLGLVGFGSLPVLLRRIHGNKLRWDSSRDEGVRVGRNDAWLRDTR
jgi:hypothetical protein